jgi:hypothetical protein
VGKLGLLIFIDFTSVIWLLRPVLYKFIRSEGNHGSRADAAVLQVRLKGGCREQSVAGMARVIQ